jgi:hypothetical protein
MGIHYQFNPIALIQEEHANVVAALQQSSLFAQLGDRLSKLPPELELPPGYAVPDFGYSGAARGGIPRELVWSELKEDFAGDCARYAVLGMTTACDVYLQHLSLTAAVTKEVAQHGGSLSGEVFNEIRRRHLEKLKRARYTSKSDNLPTGILNMVRGDISKITGLEWFISIFKLRNCIVHRRAVVSQDDVDDVGMFRLTWRKQWLTVDGTEVTVFPIRLEAGQTVRYHIGQEVREWHQGDSIQLSPRDCSNIAFSLFLFCSQMSEELGNSLAALLTS